MQLVTIPLNKNHTKYSNPSSLPWSNMVSPKIHPSLHRTFGAKTVPREKGVSWEVSNNNNTFFENYSAKPISTSGRVSRQGARATGMTLPSARALLCNFGATGLSALWGGERLAHLLYTSVCSQGPWPPAKKKKKKTTQREQAAAENDKKNARK